MYLKFDDGFSDCDLEFLRDLFALLDARWNDLQTEIHGCSDPDAAGLFDEAEYLAGMGFAACQRYLASTYGPHCVEKNTALAVGPHHSGGESFARIINAAANCWKHSDEWEADATITRNIDALEERQKKTIRIIESVTSWSDYTCANLLFELTTPDVRLSALVPTLEDWRQAMDSAYVKSVK